MTKDLIRLVRDYVWCVKKGESVRGIPVSYLERYSYEDGSKYPISQITDLVNNRLVRVRQVGKIEASRYEDGTILEVRRSGQFRSIHSYYRVSQGQFMLFLRDGPPSKKEQEHTKKEELPKLQGPPKKQESVSEDEIPEGPEWKLTDDFYQISEVRKEIDELLDRYGMIKIHHNYTLRKISLFVRNLKDSYNISEEYRIEANSINENLLIIHKQELSWWHGSDGRRQWGDGELGG